MPKVSVIIPVYNRPAVLSRAVESVRRQTFQDFELIVVDDGSATPVPGAIRSPENRGVSHARNLGAAAARGEWLAFLDSDDEWLPEKLERQLALADRFDWIHGNEIWMRDGKRVNPPARYLKQGGWVFDRCAEVCFISASTTMIRREAFESFREDFPVCEDFELWLRLSSRMPVGYVEEPVQIRYGGHADQLSRTKMMDLYRVRALALYLDRPGIAAHASRLCEILLKGFEKYGNTVYREEVARIFESASQITHSASERFPRSELSGTL